MWYLWTTLLVLSCALGISAEDAGALNEQNTKVPEPLAATTRSPPRTLDRKSAELAWRNWLQSPESGNQNAPPRRITTKSLFITPLVCPKGQRLDRNGCVQVVTVDKDEHERILLEQLNALFTSSPSGDVLYDYDENEPGPLQLSIPIGLDPQAAPLQAQEPSGQAQELQPSYVKVDTNEKPNTDASIEAELEILKLGHQSPRNDTASPITKDDLHHNVLNNYLPFGEKPKRDSSTVNQTSSDNSTEDVGQKEIVYGHVNVDPVEYDAKYKNPSDWSKPEITLQNDTLSVNKDTVVPPNNFTDLNKTTVNETLTAPSKHHQELKKDDDNAKLSPENEYSNIGEAIKLISRYAEVTTDDNFAKDKKHTENDDSILGTRTKLQHRRKIPKKPEFSKEYKMEINRNVPAYTYYRYSWPSRESAAPPSDYPFRHLQDYWPGKTQAGGVYNTVHENPRRHHHSYPHHSYFYPRNLRIPYGGFPGQYPRLQHFYPQYQGYPHRMSQHHAKLIRSYTNNQDLYSLLGLRHWFSGEGASKR